MHNIRIIIYIFVFNVNFIFKKTLYVTNYNTFIVQKHSKGHLRNIIKERYNFIIKTPVSKTPIIIPEAVWIVKWPSYVVRTSARWCFWWDNSPGNSVSGARALNSSDSSECLWLAIAFMSSTESSVIGYNDQSNINASVSGSAQANADLNLAADDLTHWTF